MLVELSVTVFVGALGLSVNTGDDRGARPLMVSCLTNTPSTRFLIAPRLGASVAPAQLEPYAVELPAVPVPLAPFCASGCHA